MPSLSGVTSPVVGQQLDASEAAVLVPDGHPSAGPRERPVDAAHERLDLGPHRLVLRDVLAAGHDDLDQRDLPAQPRMALEEVLERAQPECYALGVVEAVDAEHELALRQQAMELACLFGHLRCGRRAHEGVVVDADGKAADAQLALADGGAHHRRSPLEAEVLAEDLRAREEVAAIARGLEAHEVVLQQRIDQRLAPRQLHEDVGRGEGDVQEERDARLRAQRAQLLAHVHQVIVVDPDEIRGPCGERHRVRVLAIHVAVDVPVARVEVAERREVVEERPHDLVGEAEVEIAHLLGIERHGRERIARFRTGGLERGCEAAFLARSARPADPRAATVAQHGQQRRHEATAAGLSRPLARGRAPERDGKAVGNDDEARAPLDGPLLPHHAPAARRQPEALVARVDACTRMPRGMKVVGLSADSDACRHFTTRHAMRPLLTRRKAGNTY
jgi:hypothetical protein